MGTVGNKPDCAYFLLLGLCGAAFLLTIGGILTYVGFNPGAVHKHHHHHYYHYPNNVPPTGHFRGHGGKTTHHSPHENLSSRQHENTERNFSSYNGSSNWTHHRSEESVPESTTVKQSLVLAILGPICLFIGILVTLVIGVLALKYDCDHEPEPNIAFLRLRSEMQLNLDPTKNDYELLVPTPESGRGSGPSPLPQDGGYNNNSKGKDKDGQRF